MSSRRSRLSTTLLDDTTRAWPAAIALAVTLLLCTWTFGVPRFGAPDELDHTTKAYGTAHRETIGAPVPDASPLLRYFVVPKGLISGSPNCFAFHSDINASCSVQINDSQLTQIDTAAGTYPPVYYAVVGGISRLVGADQSPLSYRFITALIGAALFSVALVLMRRAAGRRAALALIALTPMTVFVVASTNPASVELAGTLVLWGYIAVLLTSDRVAGRRQLLIASTIAAVIVLVRPVALAWVLVAFGVLLLLERRPLTPDRKALARLLSISAIPLIVAVVLSSAWSRYAGVGLADDRYLVTDSTVTIFRTGLGRTAELLQQAFGWLGWLDTQLPTPTYALWIVTIVLIGVLVAFGTDRRIVIALTAIGLIWVFYPVAYVVFAKTPQVWQGRYNLPLLGGVVLCGLLSTADAHPESTMARQADAIARFCAAAWVVIEVVAFYQTLRRFMVGATGSLLLRGGWMPPINAYVLLVVNAATAVAIAWLLLRPRSVVEFVDAPR